MIFVIFLNYIFHWKQDFYILKACLAFLFVRFKRLLIHWQLWILYWNSFLTTQLFVKSDILNTILSFFSKTFTTYPLQYASEKSIFGLLISNPRNRKLEIFRYYAQNRREILNLSIHVFSKSAKGLLLNNSLK